MRAAPAVVVTCTGGSLWRSLLWLLPAGAAVALVVWVTLQAGLPTWVLWALAVPAGAAAAAVAARQRPPPASLAWDGAQWTCQGVPVQVQVDIDLGPWMLLRLFAFATAEPAAAARAAATASTSPVAPCPRWVAVSRGDAGSAMHAFRAAVYCRAIQPTTTNGRAPKPP